MYNFIQRIGDPSQSVLKTCTNLKNQTTTSCTSFQKLTVNYTKATILDYLKRANIMQLKYRTNAHMHTSLPQIYPPPDLVRKKQNQNHTWIHTPREECRRTQRYLHWKVKGCTSAIQAILPFQWCAHPEYIIPALNNTSRPTQKVHLWKQ